MTETKFKPPFISHRREIWGNIVFSVEDSRGFELVETTNEKSAVLVADALNFYYAKKGEKE